jgi:molecular chaperone GrpE
MEPGDHRELNGGEEAAAGAPGENDAGAGTEDLTLAELRKKAEERDLYRNELLRSRADFDNYQKRVRKDRAGWEALAVRRFIGDLLPVVDNFERALAALDDERASRSSFAEGVRLTYQLLRQVLADHGVEEIPAVGELFNPEVHEAVVEEEVADRPTGEILEVFQKGYRHGDGLLRPSKVKVAKNVNAEETESHADL